MNSPPLPAVNLSRRNKPLLAKSSAGTRNRPQTCCKVGLVGFGTVGRAVAKILGQRSCEPLRLTHVCSRTIKRQEVDWLPPEVRWTDDVNEVLAADVDIIVELVGGLEPADDWIRTALLSGKSVVTANKQLIAHRGSELLALARKVDRQLAFGAAVAGGIPVVSGMQEGLAGDRLFRICGILNGTCNYVLSCVESASMSFVAAIQRAQKLGFAEADPREDVDGLDAAAKLVILASVGLQVQLQLQDVLCRSIRDIEAVDFVYAHELGCSIRQVARAELDGKRLFASVQPALVPLSSPLARVQGSQNLVSATGKFGGETLFSGHGAGGNPTAIAVVSDLLAIAEGKVNPLREVRTCKVSHDFVSRHYVRFTVKDRPGIIASLAATASQCHINIDSVLQKPGYPKSRLPFVITFEPCSAAVIEKALEKIRRMDFLLQPPVCLPMLT